MQKIFEQQLGGNKEQAEKIVKYTWEKDEIAFYFCSTYRDVFKVQFTGVRWFMLSRWGNGDKIYQYKYLESSGDHNLQTKGIERDGISQGHEDEFYTTKEEAIERAFRYIKRVNDDAMETFKKDMNRITLYENEQ